jgi:hypothetical protein
VKLKDDDGDEQHMLMVIASHNTTLIATYWRFLR